MALCWGGSLWLGTGEAVFAQLDPLPTVGVGGTEFSLEGYQRFRSAQTLAQRLQLARRASSPEPMAAADEEPITLAEAQSSLPATALTAATPPPTAPVSDFGSPPLANSPEKPLTPEELNRQRLQRLLAEGAAAHARRQAQQAQATPAPQPASPATPTAAVPTLDSLRLSQPMTSQAEALRVEEQPWLRPTKDSVPLT
ncbi:hypothetical protein NW819_06680, partial [Synechococcus sp. R8-2]